MVLLLPSAGTLAGTARDLATHRMVGLPRGTALDSGVGGRGRGGGKGHGFSGAAMGQVNRGSVDRCCVVVCCGWFAVACSC